MMIHYLYSPSTRGFYREGVSSIIPDDVIRVSEKRHAQLLQAQSEGAAIVPCAKTGKPLLDLPPRDAASLRAALVLQVKSEAGRRIRAVSPMWRQMNDIEALVLGQADDGAKARLSHRAAVRYASDLIEDQLRDTKAGDLEAFPVAQHPFWPETD